jgi:cellulose synthase/poly-beta-1,6-N-acetylglucosamine synthase-like glycosyltransferase
MISIVITSSTGSKPTRKAIEAIFNNDIKEKYELIIITSDKATEKIVNEFKKTHKQIKCFKDSQKGKRFALNDVFKILQGRIWIFTEGDVYVGKGGINEFLRLFENPKIGCITGRPISTNSKKNMLGFWSHLLCDAGAHSIRKELNEKNCFLECTSYLFGFRNNITKNIPLDVAEDSIIPYLATKKGYNVKYSEKATVFVLNPTNLKDFINQKIKTAKAHEALEEYAPFFPKVKSFRNEIKKGTYRALAYPKNLKEFFWTIILFFIRFYIWMKVKWDEKIIKNNLGITR